MCASNNLDSTARFEIEGTFSTKESIGHTRVLEEASHGIEIESFGSSLFIALDMTVDEECKRKGGFGVGGGKPWVVELECGVARDGVLDSVPAHFCRGGDIVLPASKLFASLHNLRIRQIFRGHSHCCASPGQTASH